MMYIFISVLSALATTSTTANQEIPKVSLDVPSGEPLRLYLTKRVPTRTGAPVEAKLLEPIFAFNKEVVPAGTIARGEVSRVEPCTKWQRTRAILNGDFTPLRKAEVEFTTLILPDGRKIPTHTIESVALNSIYRGPSKKKKSQSPHPQDQNGGLLGNAKQTIKDQVQSAIDARRAQISDIVQSPNRKEQLGDFLWAKLPYHPQYVRRGAQFDAVLRDPLQFGFESINRSDLAELGSQPRSDNVVRVRLLTAVDSGSAKQGEAVEAELTAPLFSPDHRLILPEGSRLTGTVVLAKKARSFHRAGQLRFNFERIDLPQQAANLRPQVRAVAPIQTQATLLAAEPSGSAPIKVDSEGGVQAQESRTRFIAPVLSLIIASQASNIENHHPDADDVGRIAGTNANVAGRTLGGGMGFGLLGAAASQSSKYVGLAFGYYGLAWSVYANVVARGGDVQFSKNAMMDIKFGARTPPGVEVP